MRILAYKGVSWHSKLIRFYTRSEYSHVAIEWENKKVTEALASYGVVSSNNYKEHHTPGPVVDVFDVVCDEEMAWTFCRSVLGEEYDFSAIARFVTKRKKHTPRRWFCSELVFRACKEGDCRLLERVQAETLSPGDIVSSPLLLPDGSKVV